MECTCSILGTDPERFACDKFTGMCHCLPNVEGENCDKYVFEFVERKPIENLISIPEKHPVYVYKCCKFQSIKKKLSSYF